MHILKGYTWFTQLGSFVPIGIVIAENGVGEERAYIGKGFNGEDPITDATHIAKTGAIFPLDIAKQMIEV